MVNPIHCSGTNKFIPKQTYIYFHWKLVLQPNICLWKSNLVSTRNKPRQAQKWLAWYTLGREGTKQTHKTQIQMHLQIQIQIHLQGTTSPDTGLAFTIDFGEGEGDTEEKARRFERCLNAKWKLIGGFHFSLSFKGGHYKRLSWTQLRSLIYKLGMGIGDGWSLWIIL